ncbi:hypothetical protein [Desulfurispira natronophila]|uniref:Ribosomal protein L37AE/L43A n=1 Tax=Desulfurispira natronophila TaxID=682562 RepID=A0A7W7Y5X0_9BACT|nr:hypothetical protein [Desulfurispira natronophila]MBB5022639.1 ribosomal protein L37AE/L43A [Desulfurispira natronophila]
MKHPLKKLSHSTARQWQGRLFAFYRFIPAVQADILQHMNAILHDDDFAKQYQRANLCQEQGRFAALILAIESALHTQQPRQEPRRRLRHHRRIAKAPKRQWVKRQEGLIWQCRSEGMSWREISYYLQEVFGVKVSAGYLYQLIKKTPPRRAFDSPVGEPEAL